MAISHVDLHMHSTASDGSDTPSEIVRLAGERGIHILALTDHDTAAGAGSVLQDETVNARKIRCGEHCGRQEKENILRLQHPQTVFIPGIELSSRSEAGLCHILGLHYDTQAAPIAAAVEELRGRRLKKTSFRIENLKNYDGIELTPEEIDWIFSHEAPGRPHIAQCLMKRGLVSSVTEAFMTYLNSRHSPVPPEISRIEASISLAAVHEAGGISCWAHPLGGEGERHISREEFEEQLAVLMRSGLMAIECYYSRYTKEETAFLLEQAKKHGLLVSGGSDYHGTNKDIPMGCLSADELTVEPEQLTILREIL